nr:hypothetical protein CFP56_20801 [Quercus suber]
MDLKDWTGTTTFLARSMLTLGTVAVTLSLAKEVSLAVAEVESDVETVTVMVGLRPISTFLSSSQTSTRFSDFLQEFQFDLCFPTSQIGQI